MEVYILTAEQMNQLSGETYDGVQFFNTYAVDADGNPYISKEVYSSLTLVRANQLGISSWWLTLPLIPFNPVIISKN
jgi:hypothetical protein